MGKRKDNTAVLVELMTYPKTGPLMQAFIMQAIEKYAAAVVKAGPAAMDTPLVSGEAWHACAVEAAEAIKTHYSN